MSLGCPSCGQKLTWLEGELFLQSQTTTTDDAGRYVLKGLRPHVYRVRVLGGTGLHLHEVARCAGWREVSAPVWNAASPVEVKYDFDALVVGSQGWRGQQALLTFGGDRETFDFGDPLNYTRVDNDVWRYVPDRATGRG